MDHLLVTHRLGMESILPVENAEVKTETTLAGLAMYAKQYIDSQQHIQDHPSLFLTKWWEQQTEMYSIELAREVSGPSFLKSYYASTSFCWVFLSKSHQ